MTDVLPARQMDGRPTGDRWPPLLRKLAFGGDYNPEQWPREVWAEDVRLMREAGVTLVTVGVFSWAMIEPAPGRYDFEWMDEVLDRLDRAQILLCLATPTAAPPAWLAANHPTSLPVTSDGVRLGIGSRESFCPNSADYRAAAVNIAGQLARRYGAHPGLALWHIGNEFGSHVGECFCETCAAAFIEWLKGRYGQLDALNEGWGTPFWGQRYGDWSEITPPRQAPMPVNPTQQLDYRRFSSDAHLDCYRGERDAVREITPAVPITTNFMATSCMNLNYWRWAPEVDVVSNNHYLTAEAPANYIDLALSADLTRGLAGGAPWLLMETSTSAVNWQPRNIAKVPGELRRNVFSHIARGADGAMFFQWRASRYGGEKFHSAMLPQSGTRSRVWAEVVSLGAELALIEELQGTRVVSDVALLWDWESWWALDLEYRPSADLDYRERVHSFYEALWRDHRTTDVVSPIADLSGYSLVVVPSLYLLTPGAAENIRRYVEAGGTLVVSYFSGIVDEQDTVYPGPYPGAFRDLVGLWIDEFHPLRKGASVALETGARGSVWSEAVIPESAEVVDRFADGPDAGSPAVTRNRFGRGAAWYVATALDAADLQKLFARIEDGRDREPRLPDDLEAVRRASTNGSYLFLINHGETPARVRASGTDLLTGVDHDGGLTVPAGGVAVLRQRG